jgi:uncharacterized membrane protein YfcA
MLDAALIAIIAVFILAGAVKGVLGLGLPTIAMGLLAVTMTPGQAAAMLVVPSLLTNVWQMLGGPFLWTLIKRLGGMLIAVCIGTWLGAGWLTGPYGRYGVIALGLSLIGYAILGLSAVRIAFPRSQEIWLGPLVGLVTGLITAATGVFVIPAVVYLQGIGLEKEELVQALGLSFTVSTVALSFNLIGAGVLNVSLAASVVAALVAAVVGMWIGQSVRLRLAQATFRRWFFIGLLALGVYLAGRALI